VVASVRLAIAVVFIIAVLTSLSENIDAHPPRRCVREGITHKGDSTDNIVFGTTERDVIHGGKGNDHIFAFSGNDLICGGRGSDEIVGGDGVDHSRGGKGNDVCDTEHYANC